MFVKRTNIQGLMESKFGKYALKEVGVKMPNCFTYACARISEIVGYNQVLDRYKVPGAQDLWYAHAPEFKQAKYAKEGALMIWQGNGYGHVAVCEELIDKNTVAWSQSNYGGNMFDYVVGNPNGYCGMTFLGYLYHKDLDKVIAENNNFETGFDMSQVIPQNGTARFDYIDIPVNVHKGSPYGPVVAQYKKGQSVKYWGYYVGDKNRYVVYTGASGNTNFVAVSGSPVRGVDKWAECF